MTSMRFWPQIPLILALLAACEPNPAPDAPLGTLEDAGVTRFTDAARPDPIDPVDAQTSDPNPIAIDASTDPGRVDAGEEDAGVDPWATVKAAVEAATDRLPEAFALVVYDDTHTLQFEHAVNGYDLSARIPVASGSKLVTATLLFQVIGTGALSLDTTTGDVLGWTGDKRNITVRQLLSFTSGLPPNAGCTAQPNLSLEACVDQIAMLDLAAPPGTRYDYGSPHMHVAARMAEVVTGLSYNELFATRLAQPLGIESPDAAFYTAPIQGIGLSNPLAAGGLHATPDEYARYLTLVLNRGEFEGERLAPAALFAVQRFAPHPDATIGLSPIVNLNIGLSFQYGLGAWLECNAPQDGCDVISSAGAFGFVPWVDHQHGYHAMIVQYVNDPAIRQDALRQATLLQQTLRPLIETALTN